MRLFILVFIACTVAKAEDSLNVSRLGTLPSTWSEVYDVIVTDTLAYVAAWSAMHILDVSDPDYPLEIGAIETPGAARASVVDNATLYVADGTSGLLIIDVSDPTHPVLLGSYDTPSIAHDVRVRDNIAYVVDVQGGLRIIDVSIPDNPVELGFFDTPSEATSLDLEGDLAFMAVSVDGLSIIDISDPEAPLRIGHFQQYCRDVSVEGDYAYLAAMTDGMRIVNISDPTEPFLEMNYDTPDFTNCLEAEGNYVYIASMGGGVVIIDISNPETPFTVWQGADANGINVFVSGSLLAVAGYGSGTWFLDISTPSSPQNFGTYGGITSGKSLTVVNGYPVAADFQQGAVVIDASDPTAPWITECQSFARFPNDVTSWDSLVCIVTDWGDFTVLGMSDVGRLQPLSNIDISDECFNVTAHGETTYVGSVDWNGQWLLQCFDITVAEFPVLLSATPMYGYTGQMVLNGETMYAIETDSIGRRYIAIFDISNALDIVEIGRFLSLSSASELAIEGNNCYVVGRSEYSSGSQMQIWDVSNSEAPLLLSSTQVPVLTNSITVHGSLAFTVSETGRMQVYDTSNPSTPALAGYYSSGKAMTDVIIEGCLAFVLETSGFTVFDISHFIPCGRPREPNELLIAYDIESHRVRLSWQPVTMSVEGAPIEIDRYLIYRSTDYDSEDWVELGVPVPQNATEFYDSVLLPGGVFYRVVAVTQ